MSQPKRRPPEKRSGNDSDKDESDSESEGFLGGEPHWGKVYNPGKITVSDPSHARLIEETDNADNPRVEFVGDAAKLDSAADVNNGEDNND